MCWNVVVMNVSTIFPRQKNLLICMCVCIQGAVHIPSTIFKNPNNVELGSYPPNPSSYCNVILYASVIYSFLALRTIRYNARCTAMSVVLSSFERTDSIPCIFICGTGCQTGHGAVNYLVLHVSNGQLFSVL